MRESLATLADNLIARINRNGGGRSVPDARVTQTSKQQGRAMVSLAMWTSKSVALPASKTSGRRESLSTTACRKQTLRLRSPHPRSLSQPETLLSRQPSCRRRGGRPRRLRSEGPFAQSVRQPHTRLRRGDCAPPPSPQTPKMVFSRDPLHHSRFAGEVTQGVAFNRSAPPARSRNAPAIRCHGACCIPPAADLLRVLSLKGIRGGFAVRRNARTLIRRDGSGSRFREGCCFALSLRRFANSQQY
jgi:hypothetical protein